MITDPSELKVAAELEEKDLLRGCNSGLWRIVSIRFPILDFAISATEPDGSSSEYGFRAELSNFPSQAPMVHIWDHECGTLLLPQRRPRGGERVEKAFQQWGSDTVYRPWDRMTGPHNHNAANFPHLAWNADRHLVFIFEDLYAILNSNARSQNLRTAA